MTEKKARKQLARMLKDLTGGSILGLLAQVYLESAEKAGQDGAATAHEQFTMAHNTLVVVGHGVDAVCPR